MELIDPKTLPTLLFFVLPGYLSWIMWRVYFPGRTTRMSDNLIAIVMLGLANYILVGWWLLPISQNLHRFWQVLVAIGTFLVAPLVWPIVIRLSIKIPFIAKHTRHPMPKAWDYFFGVVREECFVLIRLKNGRLLGGVMSTSSFASSYPSDEDLYLEEVWRTTNDGAFVEPIPDTGGILVSRTECEYIQFIKLSREMT